MIKKRTNRILLITASFIIIFCVAATTVWSWNVKTVRISGGISITPAYASGRLLLPESGEDYLFVKSEYGDLRPLTAADPVNNGDAVYVKMFLRNDSNVPMFCRFKIDPAGDGQNPENNVDAEYRFFIDNIDTGYSSESEWQTDGGGWYYYQNAVEAETERTVWIEISVIDKTSSDIVIGVPYADMIQARGDAVSSEDGWNEIYPEFFKQLLED